MDRLIKTYALLLQSYELETVRVSMEKRGHGKLWRRALCEAVRLFEKQTVRTAEVLTLARESDKERHAVNIAKANGISAHIVVDPTIVGGFILQKGFSRIDRSYKTALINLYRKVTA